MKKAVVTVSVLIVFVIYSLAVRHKTPVLSTPSSLTSSKRSSSKSNSKKAKAAAGSTTANNSSTSSSSPSAVPSAPKPTGQYKDGTFRGSAVNVYYGNVQVAAIINGGKIKTVKILQYPNSHSTSVYINQQAIPFLQKEAIKAQNAKVQIISGATFTSEGFAQSLNNALSKAKA